ncbi:DEAD/DEAH box helicase, partial [Pseudomonas amygdali pv. lachrymans]
MVSCVPCFILMWRNTMNDITLPRASSHLKADALNIGLTEFIEEFGDQLLESLNRSNPPVYAGIDNPAR